MRAYNPNGKTIIVGVSTPTNNNNYTKSSRLLLSGTSLSFGISGEGSWTGSTWTSGNKLKITHVEGVERIS